MAVTLVFAVLWFLFIIFVGIAGFVYLDAPDYGMDARKWTKLTLMFPVFGFRDYLAEREKRQRIGDEREELFADGAFQVHKSRAEDAPWTESGETDDDEFDP